MTRLSGTLHTFCVNYFISGKSDFLGDNVKKCSRGGRSHMTTRSMLIACWITNAIYAITICNIYFFPLQKLLQGRPQCFVVRTLPVLLLISSSHLCIRKTTDPSLKVFVPLALIYAKWIPPQKDSRDLSKWMI